MNAKVLVEVVACTADDACHAEAAGADRIELVSAISEGGLTPSVGALKETKARCRLPVMAMVGPRGGGFVYTESEFQTMLRDVEALLEAGADGIVVGCLSPFGEIDEERMSAIHSAAKRVPCVCHRAFDLAADPTRALETLANIGFTRILSNGQASDALTGGDRLKAMIEQAGNRIEILPGGGVRASNAAEIVVRTGANQVHLGPFRKSLDIWSGNLPGSTMSEHLTLDPEEVAELVQTSTHRR